jgi:hypothetical protein
MKNKQNAKVGDRVVYDGQPKTAGVAVEIHDYGNNGKDIKVHWSLPPIGDGLHRNGRGSYSIDQLKLMRI